jgi:hypothetical protein
LTPNAEASFWDPVATSAPERPMQDQVLRSSSASGSNARACRSQQKWQVTS